MTEISPKAKQFSWELCGSPYLLFLIVLYVTFSLLGTVLLYKLVVVGPGMAPGGLFVLPFVLLIEDIVAEVYGYKISRLLLWFVFLSMIVFTIGALLIIHLPSPPYWHLQSSFDNVFNPILRGAPSLIIALLVSRFINIFLITKLKILVKGKYFWPRSIFSTLLGGAIGLIIAFSLAYGTSVPLAGIEKLILTDYFVRFLYAMLGGGPAWLFVIFLKKRENVDVYDIGTNFNPFKLTLKDENREHNYALHND